MPQSKLYLCESAGARLLEYGTGITQIGTEFQLDLKTWGMLPAGEVGDNSFRSIDVVVDHENGYNVGITPIVDGVDQPEQFFSAVGSGLAQLQAFFAIRGTEVAARVRTLSKTGAVFVRNISCAHVVIRTTP